MGTAPLLFFSWIPLGGTTSLKLMMAHNVDSGRKNMSLKDSELQSGAELLSCERRKFEHSHFFPSVFPLLCVKKSKEKSN